jgi:hypothetical protein
VNFSDVGFAPSENICYSQIIGYPNGWARKKLENLAHFFPARGEYKKPWQMHKDQSWKCYPHLLTVCYGKLPFISLIFALNMVIFHSYVSFQ